MKTSSIWKLTKSEFQSVVDSSTSMKEILKKFDLSSVSGNYITLQKRFVDDKINLSKLKLNQKHRRSSVGKTHNPEKFSDEKIFVKNSIYGRRQLKQRILRKKLIPYECESCHCLPIWMNKKLVLVLDHKNGVNNDNELENLRFLCPNCNSQTSTFAGRNRKGK